MKPNNVINSLTKLDYSAEKSLTFLINFCAGSRFLLDIPSHEPKIIHKIN